MLRAGSRFRGTRGLLTKLFGECWIVEQRENTRPLLQVQKSVSVFEALVHELEGATAIAEVEIGFRDVGEDEWIFRRKGQGGLGVRKGFIAEPVFGIKHGKHGLGGGVVR